MRLERRLQRVQTLLELQPVSDQPPQDEGDKQIDGDSVSIAIMTAIPRVNRPMATNVLSFNAGDHLDPMTRPAEAPTITVAALNSVPTMLPSYLWARTGWRAPRPCRQHRRVEVHP